MRFDDCLQVVLQFEGGYVHDPTDRGGATNKGITQRTYDAWRIAQKLPVQSVQVITDTEVATIYKEQYWTELPVRLDLYVFDAAVQHGKGKAIRFLQECIGSPADGICGKNTLYAVNTYILRHSIDELLKAYLARRRAFYAAIIAHDPTQKRFEHGWVNRMRDIERM